MADLLLSALVPAVLKKAADSLVQRIGEMWGIDDQCERLHNMLLEIQAVLPDAEEKANSNTAIKSWLEKLKSATYDADDLLDEFSYEELRRDAVRRGHKVSSISRIFSLENPALFRYKMSEKLKKLVKRIDGLVLQMGRFGFGQGQHVQVPNRSRTNSLVVQSKIVGREGDKEEIVKLLFARSDSADLTVVPVVGMGGVGKTTLAQIVYHDTRVKEHFKLPLWVCVSEDFNVNYLVKSIIDLIIQGDCNVPIDNMELLQRRLHKVLEGKLYLLVLDDVWNENANEWGRLRAILNCGDSGSVVIVTTRSEKVASMMGTVKSYNLGCLGEDDSWNLFRERAFSIGVKECQELVEIGRKIVQNCRGLPLAINTLGSLMSCKHEFTDWLVILEESRIWEIRSANNEVLPILRLSYDHLPIYMKQCFAFCAIFPKDYEMDKEKLIRYWMANGFIPSDGPGSLETKGNDIFNELAWRSFFHDVKEVCPVTLDYSYRTEGPLRHKVLPILRLSYDHFSPYIKQCFDLCAVFSKDNEIDKEKLTQNIKFYPITLGYRRGDGHRSETKCKMHDLALSIMGDECLSTLKIPTQPNYPMVNIRHISTKKIPLDINMTMNWFPSIRSLISTSMFSPYVHNIGFFKSNSLRILGLDVSPIVKTMVTPKKMKHLRYLEISGIGSTSLPKEISTLYLLQTLRLTWCTQLSELPEGMRYMSSLRYLYIENCYNLRRMPTGLGMLNHLQILTAYIIGTGLGNSIAELKNLNLHGQLHLYNIREVKDAVNAREANLIAKMNLEDLALCWGHRNNYRSANFEVAKINDQEVMHSDPHEVLDALKPCNNIKVLQVTQYPGDKFSVWMTEYSILENLIELYIIDCRKCTIIPPVDKLPYLRILSLKFLNNLRHLCQSGSSSGEISEDVRVVFPSLKSMLLSEMPNLGSWCAGEVRNDTSLVFPVLKRLDIINCPKLSAMPIVPLLENLSVKGNNYLSCFATSLTTLQELSLESHNGDAESANESLSFQPWENLRNLSLIGYNIIEPLGANEAEDNFLGLQQESPSESTITETLLPKLDTMWIQHCPNLVEIPKCSTSIQQMIICGCPKLHCLPEWLGSIVGLKELEIAVCENLAHLPQGMEGLKTLEILKIRTCPNIKVLPEGLLRQLKNLDEL